MYSKEGKRHALYHFYVAVINYLGHIKKKNFDLQFHKVKSLSWWGGSGKG